MFFNFLYIFVIMHWDFFSEMHVYKKKIQNKPPTVVLSNELIKEAPKARKQVKSAPNQIGPKSNRP